VSGERVTRRLAAILAADVAGYSLLVGADEGGTLERLKTLRRELLDPNIANHKGRLVKTTGDGLLVEFGSVVDALRCAVEVQSEMTARNAGVPSDNRIEFRIGINVGDIVVEDGDIFGDGVNVAARLEGLAEPGGICVSARVQEDAAGKLDLVFEDLGEQQLKNIARPIRAYRVVTAARPATPQTSSGPPLPDKPSIAVLPFSNLSGDPEQDYFADGIAQDIITLLSKSRGLFVIAHNSTFSYKGHVIEVKAVGRELGVRYVLEGSVRKAGNRVRVTAQLIEATTSGHIWAERYDRDLADIFAVQDEITTSVSTAILPALERSERERTARKPPDSLEAWECYHRGLWHFSKFEAAENTLALRFFGLALEFDPNFATAQAAMSSALRVQAAVFRPQTERPVLLPRSVEHAQRAIALDPSAAFGHSSLANALILLGRHEEAVAEADLAVNLDPNSPWAHFSLGYARAFGGRPQEAITPLMTAMRLSPFDPFMPAFLNVLARAYYWMGDYPAAVATARQLCRSFPNYQNPYRTLIAALGQTGQVGEAQRVMAEAMQRFGEDFRFHVGPLRAIPMEDRAEDREHMLDGYRKAGVLKN
jgi:adenylate cyclase